MNLGLLNVILSRRGSPSHSHACSSFHLSRGAVSTLLRVGRYVPYQQVWNLTGQPAAVVPWGFDGDGLPMSVQLVGRPYDEATLLSLSAQIEAAHPWAVHRPPVS